MKMDLPGDLNSFVQGLVLEGRFESEEAAFVAGLRLLKTQENLRSEIAKGVSQLDAEKWFDEETVFAEVNSEIDKIESNGRES